MTSIVTASNWVKEKRAFAISIVISGTSLGGMVFPVLANHFNNTYGWRGAMQLISMTPILLFLIVFLFIPSKKRKKNNSKEKQDGLKFTDALKTPTFYKILVSGALTYYAILSLYSHMFLYMRNLGYESTSASLGISTLALGGLASKLLTGLLSSHTNKYTIFKFQMGLMLLGLIGFTYFNEFIWIFILITAIGWGGLHTLYNYILIAQFGLRDAGKINGTVSFAESMGGGIGISLTGYLFDKYGSYDFSFSLIVVMMVVSLIIVIGIKETTPLSAT